MEDAVALLAQSGSRAHADAEGVAPVLPKPGGSHALPETGSHALPKADDVVEATRAACLEDEVLKYVAGEGAKRFNLISVVPKP